LSKNEVVKIGDEVKITSSSVPRLGFLVGRKGLVKGIKETTLNSALYAVEFDSTHTKFDTNLWNCHGMVPSGRGWLFFREDFVKTTTGSRPFDFPPKEKQEVKSDEVTTKIISLMDFIKMPVVKICEFTATELAEFFGTGMFDDEEKQRYMDAFICVPELLEHSDEMLWCKIYKRTWKDGGKLYWEILKKKELKESEKPSTGSTK